MTSEGRTTIDVFCFNSAFHGEERVYVGSLLQEGDEGQPLWTPVHDAQSRKGPRGIKPDIGEKDGSWHYGFHHVRVRFWCDCGLERVRTGTGIRGVLSKVVAAGKSEVPLQAFFLNEDGRRV